MSTKQRAIDALARCGVPVGANFHTLTSLQVAALIDEADAAKYRKPANANGSRGRYFHERLQRQASRSE
jgi:hypothetical protein